MLDIPELVVSQDLVDCVHANDTAYFNLSDAPVNRYLILRSELNEKSTALVRYLGNNTIKKLSEKSNKSKSIGRDSRQAALLDSMSNKAILLNVGIGRAGTGKTTLAIHHATSEYLNHGTPIYLTKPAVTVGRSKAFGPVPGTIREKYHPYLMSYEIVLQKLLGTENAKSYLERMEHSGHLQFIPIELTRGTTFDKCTFILDEAQNLNWHELNTIISRMGDQTKMIILGDLSQIDTGMNERDTGLYQLIHSRAFQQSEITSALSLVNQYRSPITQLIADVDEELRSKTKRTSSK